MSSFGQYVDGKTIAIVGPAPAPYDQTAEVDAHDIVYRASYGYLSDGKQGRYDAGRFVPGYGTRVDMAFYNGGASRQAVDGVLDNVYQDLDWAIHKFSPGYESPLTNTRTANMPRVIHGKKVAANQVPIMLWDLTFYSPAKVTVFGADFYLGPLETWYDSMYVSQSLIDGETDPTESVGPSFHDQERNRQIVRSIRDAVNWLAGDQRFLEALDVPRHVHEAALAEQSARFNKTASTV